jgi:hypothetical protein
MKEMLESNVPANPCVTKYSFENLARIHFINNARDADREEAIDAEGYLVTELVYKVCGGVGERRARCLLAVQRLATAALNTVHPSTSTTPPAGVPTGSPPPAPRPVHPVLVPHRKVCRDLYYARRDSTFAGFRLRERTSLAAPALPPLPEFTPGRLTPLCEEEGLEASLDLESRKRGLEVEEEEEEEQTDL